MGVKDIRSELDKIFRIVAGWQGAVAVSDIERELVLDKLKHVYEEVMFFEREAMPVDGPATAESGGAAAVCGTEAPAVTETVPSVAVEAAPAPDAPCASGADAGAVVAETPAVAEQQLFDDTEVRRPAESRRQVILSLYGEEKPCASRPAMSGVPAADRTEAGREEERPGPVEGHHKRVLGEVIGTATTSVCDDFARHNDKTDLASKIQSSQVSELRRALGVNDRFLMIRDLFGGDAAACETAIAQLDSFTDLDDALIYIQETYAWNPDSEATRLVVDLLTRKLG